MHLPLLERPHRLLFSIFLLIINLAGSVTFPAPLSAQPLGDEFQVNTFTSNSQYFQHSANDASGNFTIVWESIGQDGPDAGVFGQRFFSNGTRRGGEFQVNTYTLDHQMDARIAMTGDGRFVVVWHSFGQDGDDAGIYGQRYGADGSRTGSEFRANTYTTGAQSFADVAMDANGNFVVVWQGYQPDRSRSDIFGQRYSSSGTKLGGEFLVNTYTLNPQSFPGIGMDAAGNFVVVWESTGQDGSGKCVMGRRFDSAANPLSGEFRLNTYKTGDQQRPAIDMDSAGNFITAWASFGQDGSDNGVFAQRYNSAGAKIGGEFRVNTYTTDIQEDVDMELHDGGHFVFVWHSLGQDGDSRSIYGQVYDNAGIPVGGEFHVNQYIINSQATPSIVLDPINGNFTVVWQSMLQDGGAYGVYARMFGAGVVPVMFQQIRAEAGERDIRLGWDIQADEPILGFVVLRKVNPAGLERPIQGPGLLPGNARSFLDHRIETGLIYTYAIEALLPGGQTVRSQPVTIPTASGTLSLDQNYPNPFNPVTTIVYRLPEPARVSLTIHDIRGKLVTTLHQGPRPTGRHTAVWNGRDGAGNLVGSGVYLYRLLSGDQLLTRKMIFLK